jgi:glycosyltransferase involved in cell wall biosynthesis
MHDATQAVAMNSSGDILLLFHCETNTGYAIGQLERVFHRMAVRLVGSETRVHYGYPSMKGGAPKHLAANYPRVYMIDQNVRDRRELLHIEQVVRNAGIKTVFGFDLPLAAPILAALRRGGVELVVSYWGAPISSTYPWMLRPFRRIQFVLATSRPDHFIFESHGMRAGATLGAAIPSAMTSVCRLGVDIDRFLPSKSIDTYAHRVFGIPEDRRIVFYSGHMEHRKGVHVLVRAMVDLVCERDRTDVHLLALGNQPGEESAFLPLYSGTKAERHITFGGYRSDVAELHRSAYLGAIASSGWDSFTLSAVEMAASGLPLLVSALPGLSEAVEQDITGFRLPAGDSKAFSAAIAHLLDSQAERDRMSAAARARVEAEFTLQQQEDRLVELVRKAWDRRGQ